MSHLLSQPVSGSDDLSADDTGEQPELGELGAEDIIEATDEEVDDGSATHVMKRDSDLAAELKKAQERAAIARAAAAAKVSSLDALAATIPAKGRTLPPSAVVASSPVSKKPPMPPMKTAPSAVVPVVPVAAAPIPPAPTTSPVPVAAAALMSTPPTIATMVSAQAEPAPEKKPIPKPAHTAPIVDLDSDDLIEQQTKILERTQPFDRNRIFGAADQKSTTQQSPFRPAAIPRDLLPQSAAMPATRQGGFIAHQQQQLPSVVVEQPQPQQQARPASIAPLAIDLTPQQPPPQSRIPDATQKLPAIQYVKRANNTNMIAGAIAGGVALCAVLLIGIVAVSSSSDEGNTTPSKTPSVAVKPREASKQNTARSAVIETPETTPSRAAAPLAARDEDGIPLSSPGALPSAPGSKGGSSAFVAAASNPEPAPAPVVHSSGSLKRTPKNAPVVAAAAATPEPTPAAAPPPPAAAAPAPAPARPAAPPSTTGAIDVPGNVMTVMVDGDYRRVQGGRIIVSCGHHRVNAGRGTRDIDVPCGGSVSAQ